MGCEGNQNGELLESGGASFPVQRALVLSQISQGMRNITILQEIMHVQESLGGFWKQVLWNYGQKNQVLPNKFWI